MNSIDGSLAAWRVVQPLSKKGRVVPNANARMRTLVETTSFQFMLVLPTRWRREATIKFGPDKSRSYKLKMNRYPTTLIVPFASPQKSDDNNFLCKATRGETSIPGPVVSAP